MDELNLKDFIAILWKWKFLIIIVTLVALIAGLLKCVILNDFSFSNIGENKEIDMSQTTIAGNRFITSGYVPNYVDTYNKIMLTTEFQTELLSKLSFEVDKDELEKMVSLVSDSDERGTYVAEILAIADNENQAEELVNITKAMFLEKIASIYPDFKVTDIEDTHILTQKEIKDNANIKLFIEKYGGIDSSSDEEDDSQYGLKDFLKFEIAIVIIGVGISIILVLFIEMYDPKLKSENQLRANGISDLLSLNKKDIKVLDKYDLLNVKLKEYKRISFNIAGEENESDKEIVTSFAKELKENKEKVLLIDFTNSIIEESKGIFEYLKSKNKIDEYIKKIDEVSVLPIGNSTEIISDKELEEVIEKIAEKYTKVLMYSTNSNTNGNSLVAAKVCENSVIVSTVGKTKYVDIETCKNNLKDVDCNLLGTIVVK